MKKDQFLQIVRANAKAALTPEEEAMFSAIGLGVETALQAEGVERQKQLETISKALGTVDNGESLSGIVRNLADQVQKMEDRTKRGLTAGEKYNLKKMLEDKAEEIKAARGTNNGWAIDFKAKRAAAASALMTTATVLSGAQAVNNTNVFDDLEVSVIAYPANFIIDAIGGRQVSNVPQTIKWKEQNTESDGVIGAVNEGAEKTLTDKLFVWKYANRVKYAGRIEFTEELAMDMEQLLLQIIDMFEQQVLRAWNAGTQALIIAWAPAYTTTGLDGFYKNPGIAQVIEAGKLHVSQNHYMADMVMINPVDAAKAMIHQNADGDIAYVPEAVAFAGLRPFITNNVLAGTILVGTSNIIKEQHSNFIVRRGVYGDQFIENEETIVGEVFSNLKLPTISKNSWVKLDVPTVLEALTVANA
jgi:hypothetical protein